MIGTIIFVSVLSLSVFSSWREFERQVAAKCNFVEGSAQGFAAAISEPFSRSDRTGVMLALRGVRNVPGIEFAEVKNEAGRSFLSLGAGASLVGRDGDPANMSFFDLLKADYLRVKTPLLKEGAEIGSLHLLTNISTLRQILIEDLKFLTLVMMSVVIVGIWIAQYTIGRLIEPISHLAKVMNEIGQSSDLVVGEAQTSQYKDRHDETGQLANAFSDMMGKIKDRDEKLADHRASLEKTVEKRTKDYRLAKEDAEAANAAKSDFLATMSHEIRTPMNGLLVMAEMLSGANLSTRHRRYAEIISRSGKSLLTIINDILDLSKIESGKLDLESAPFEPDAMVEDIACLFWEKARSQNVEIATYVSPNTPKTILGDVTRLNQVVTNLVNNALKFTEKGGVEIRVDARPSADGRLARMRIDVLDTGIGIPADRLDKIFEAFSQADQSTTRKFGGTGLGLAVCKRLMSAMNGDVKVASVEGKGSCFTAIADFPVVEEYAAPEKSDSGSTKLAILVDDRPDAKASMAMSSRSLARSFQDAGAQISLLKLSKVDWRNVAASSTILSHSSLIKELEASEVQIKPFNFVCLSDVGDMQADSLLTDGLAVDILPQPTGRQAIVELVTRAKSAQFRGLDALNAKPNTQNEQAFKGVHVLAADDNAVNREVLREALSTLGVTVDFAEDGQEALDMVTKGRDEDMYSLVFMDASMPVMDGFEATRRIRDDETISNLRKRIPIIGLTAQVQGVGVNHWQEVGMDDCLHKPFSIERLVSTLSKFVKPDVQVKEHANEIEDVQIKVDDTTPLFEQSTLDMFAKLSASSGNNLQQKVWSMFASTAPTSLEEIEKLAREKEPQAELISSAAHAYKSMCLSAGAKRAAEYTQLLEGAAKNEDLSELKQCVENIVASSRLTLEAMDEELGVMSAQLTQAVN